MRRVRLGLIAETALVIGILAVGKPVLVPIALAFYFAFLLTPMSAWLERVGLPRVVSLVTVMGLALGAFITLSSVLVAQLADLAAQMHSYSTQMSQKVATIRHGQIGLLSTFSDAFSDLGRVLSSQVSSTPDTTLRIAPQTVSLGDQLGELFHLLEPAAFVGIVVVLTIFVLARREDLRGRLIRLVGPQNVTVTTRTINEVAKRISHFLLTQSYINAGFATVVAFGLYLIGMPYALLWGVLAGLLRFVPLVGALIAVMLPSLVAFAVFPGWSETIMTVVLFVALDITVANFVEPVVLGRRMGVSSLALLISTLFWTWLWGPLGLVLATPLTVCAAVVGRHSEALSFLAVLLGDDPGLNAEVNFYQRVLAHANDEAQRLARRQVAETSFVETLDSMVVPALSLMARDFTQQTIDGPSAERVLRDVAAIVDQVQPASSVESANDSGVVGVPAESNADVLLLRLVSLVSPGITSLPLMPRDVLAQEVTRRAPPCVLISALHSESSANARFLCRRLSAQMPNARIVVLLASNPDKTGAETAARLREAGASSVVFELREAREALQVAPAHAGRVSVLAASSR